MAGRWPRLEVRRRVGTQTWGEMLCQEKCTEEKGCVDGVTCERVPEQRRTGEIARREAGTIAWVTAEKGPDSEVGDQEELREPRNVAPLMRRRSRF